MIAGAELNIGFGCLWDHPREATWSHTPSSLLSALQLTGPCSDLGYDARLRSQIFRMRYLGYRNGQFRSNWRYKTAPMKAATRAIRRKSRSANSDVILTIADLGVFDRPFLIYQDLSFDLVLREIQAGNTLVKANFQSLSLGELEHLAERQRGIFRHAASVLAMSHWYARSLVQDSGMDPDRVAVVRPGATAYIDLPPIEVGQREQRLLFVGRDIERKGGELLVKAMLMLRDAGEDLSLTIVGPPTRPKSIGEESWIDYRGELPPAEVAELMRSHAAFVLPTRFDAYGIVFHEALRAGTPCVGPNAFAVPEIVTDGRDGALFEDWTAEALAQAIVRAMSTDIREGAYLSAPRQTSNLSWVRAAREVRFVASGISP